MGAQCGQHRSSTYWAPVLISSDPPLPWDLGVLLCPVSEGSVAYTGEPQARGRTATGGNSRVLPTYFFPRHNRHFSQLCLLYQILCAVRAWPQSDLGAIPQGHPPLRKERRKKVRGQNQFLPLNLELTPNLRGSTGTSKAEWLGCASPPTSLK